MALAGRSRGEGAGADRVRPALALSQREKRGVSKMKAATIAATTPAPPAAAAALGGVTVAGTSGTGN